ncbi:hypothetical protein GCM10009660_14920 [Catellatospora bangladeshensis]
MVFNVTGHFRSCESVRLPARISSRRRSGGSWPPEPGVYNADVAQFGAAPRRGCAPVVENRFRSNGPGRSAFGRWHPVP